MTLILGRLCFVAILFYCCFFHSYVLKAQAYSENNFCELFKSDVDISKLELVNNILSECGSRCKAIHLRLYDGSENIYNHTSVDVDKNGYFAIFHEIGDSTFVPDSSKFSTLLTNFILNYKDSPQFYYSTCSSATGGSLDIYILQDNGQILFKYLAFRGYNQLSDIDKKELSPAIRFFESLAQIER